MQHYNKSNHEVSTRMPKVLALTSTGMASGWLSFEDYATLAAKDKILWTTHKYAVTLHGGINAKTGQQSVLEMDTIAAIKSDKNKLNGRIDYAPALTNRTLFERDRNMCAYCGNVYPTSKLSRDHVIPVSRGGKDKWTNVVTSCLTCNHWKSDSLLEEIELVLLYVPYRPSFYEHLILQNRNITADQMEFLLKGVSEHSRVYKEYSAKMAA